MLHENFWYVVAAIILIGVSYNYFFGREAVVKRKIRKANGTRIGSFMDGEVAKVVGEIKYHGKTLNAPLSGRKCVYYHILVEQEKNRENSSMQNIIDEEVSGEVIIKDGNHYALIDTSLVKSYLVPDASYSSGFLNDAPHMFDKYLARHGQSSTGLLGFNRNTRYKEGVLEQGELIAVVGKGQWRMCRELKLKIPAEKILVIGGQDQQPVYLTDDPSTTQNTEEI